MASEMVSYAFKPGWHARTVACTAYWVFLRACFAAFFSGLLRVLEESHFGCFEEVSFWPRESAFRLRLGPQGVCRAPEFWHGIGIRVALEKDHRCNM